MEKKNLVYNICKSVFALLIIVGGDWTIGYLLCGSHYRPCLPSVSPYLPSQQKANSNRSLPL